MKTIQLMLCASALTATSILFTSFKEEPKNENLLLEVSHAQKFAANEIQNSEATAILNAYLTVKDELVADNSNTTAAAARKLFNLLDRFDFSSYSDPEQAELTRIITKAKGNVENLSNGPIEQQRMHFKILSEDITDMVAITGANQKLYEQYCPMYDNGSTWLSLSAEIKNPYYGSKMLNCGKVQKEIN